MLPGKSTLYNCVIDIARFFLGSTTHCVTESSIINHQSSDTPLCHTHTVSHCVTHCVPATHSDTHCVTESSIINHQSSDTPLCHTHTVSHCVTHCVPATHSDTHCVTESSIINQAPHCVTEAVDHQSSCWWPVSIEGLMDNR